MSRKRAFKYQVSFRLRHPTVAMSALARVLPIMPRWSWQAGEARRTPKGSPLSGVYPDSYCTFDIAAGTDGEVAQHIRETPERPSATSFVTCAGKVARPRFTSFGIPTAIRERSLKALCSGHLGTWASH